MTRKFGLTAILIIAVLTIAFFWGGAEPKRSTPADGSVPAIGLAEAPDSAAADKQPGSDMQPDQAEAAASAKKPEPGDSDASKSGGEEEQVPQPDKDKPGKEKPDASAESELNPEKQGSEASELSETGGKAAKPKSPENAAQPPASKANNSSGEAKKDAKPKSAGAASTAKPDFQPKKDKYLTDPVPEGKPKPVEWQDVTVDKSKKLSVTLSVSAASILDHMDQFNEDKLEVLPENGIIYPAQTVTFYEGESVFDVLLREMKNNGIHMEFVMTPIYNSNYVEGINNLYEFDCGELSGWMYKVNDWFPNYGSSRYELQDGDVVEWVYTCDLGRDIGGDMAGGIQ